MKEDTVVYRVYAHLLPQTVYSASACEATQSVKLTCVTSSISPSVRPSVLLSVCLSVCLCVCLSKTLWYYVIITKYSIEIHLPRGSYIIIVF